MNEELKEKVDYYEFLIDFVSHEIRNPLSAVIMFAKMLKENSYGNISERQVDILDRILANTARIEHMTDDFLNLSRIDSMDEYLNKEEIDLYDDVIESAIEHLESKHLFTHEQGKAFRSQRPDSVKIVADKLLLRVVFDNLLFNAMKYGREGGKMSYGWKDNGSEILINVSNEGQGVRKEQLENIFEKFVRLRDQNISPKRGTGLGLFNVRKIIERHGGRTWAESDYGKSFTVFFTIPKPVPEKTAEGPEELQDKDPLTPRS